MRVTSHLLLLLLSLALVRGMRDLAPELADTIRRHYPVDGVNEAPYNATVSINFHIYSVFGLDEREVMEINGWVILSWRDPRITWNPRVWANISSILLNSHKVWTPDVGISNSKQQHNKDFSAVPDLRVRADNSGKIVMYSYFLSETPCPIETFLFPFDQQKCALDISTYYSDSFSIKLDHLYFKTLGKNTVGEWLPLGYTLRQVDHLGREMREKDNSCRIFIHLGRKPLYHIVLVLIPFCLTSVVANLLFLLRPPQERLRVCLCVLLSMTVFDMIVSRQAPKSMRGPSLLGIFLLNQMSFLVMLTFIVVIGPLLLNNEEQEEKREALRICGRRMGRWTKRYDRICLLIHVVASVVNGLICLVVIPVHSLRYQPERRIDKEVNSQTNEF